MIQQSVCLEGKCLLIHISMISRKQSSQPDLTVGDQNLTFKIALCAFVYVFVNAGCCFNVLYKCDVSSVPCKHD